MYPRSQYPVNRPVARGVRHAITPRPEQAQEGIVAAGIAITMG